MEKNSQVSEQNFTEGIVNFTKFFWRRFTIYAMCKIEFHG